MAKEVKKDKGTRHPSSKPIKRIEGVRSIVRLAEADVVGTKKTAHALLKIKGIGQPLAKIITELSRVDPNKMIGELTDEEVKKIEEIVLDPAKHGVPAFLLNRRNDPETGENLHKTSSELIFTRKSDIDAMRKIQCYKGVRHQLGLPVRGQRTRSSFRTGSKVGVVKKKK